MSPLLTGPSIPNQTLASLCYNNAFECQFAPYIATTALFTCIIGHFVLGRISAVLAPARSEETEAQRSSKARLVRSTRRSTQGIANDVLEEAKRLSVAGASTPTPSTPAAAVAAVVSPTPVQVRATTFSFHLSPTPLLCAAMLYPRDRCVLGTGTEGYGRFIPCPWCRTQIVVGLTN